MEIGSGSQQEGSALSLAVMRLQVFVKRDGEKMSLVVDGISSQSRRIPAAVATHLSGPLHVGGAPAAKLVKHLNNTYTTSATTAQLQQGFYLSKKLCCRVCVCFLGSRIQWFQWLCQGPDAERSPCRKPQPQPGGGALFSGSPPARRLLPRPGGSHGYRCSLFFSGVLFFVFLSCALFTKAPPLFCRSIAQSVVLDGDLEVQLEIRPVSDSGLLLLVGKSPEQHLSVVLSHGEVRKR